jgi:hypothetical protein
MKKTLSLFILISLIALMSACGKTPDQAADANAANAASTTTTADASAKPPFSSGSESPESKGGLFSRLVAEPITIPSGTPVTVRLQTGVSSATNNSGDTFDAVLDAPLVINGKTVAPAGAPVSGKVVAAKSSGHLKDPGMIQLALSSITIDKKAIPVSSSSVVARGASHTKRNAAIIGGSTGGGALLGGILGGGKGALIGAGVGAAGGTTGAYATGKKDVGFAAERRLTFRLTQAITVKS